ncbi:hypothetical protein AcW1_005640 [Taiwanofungus camphoratus]|nr:hypothetical protein AcW2_004405 [Antrodia cinnamomea]KAI0933162.1 hypothetical protein AcV7_004716 [Antrodia cinnamomea]KAI0933967.1 hypothetical protein AcV5_005967 [Antrodia cinnamomea]KAI0957162.1 hypothetical protein AcW1_005640 [Antrodia cinnamomea]
MASAPKSAKPAGPKEKTLKIAKKATSTKATAKLAASHPSWKDMIKECIVDHPEDARSGVSRATIKKYITEKYKLEIEGANASQLNRAIAHGAQIGIFALPKGPSGKVKLAPKLKPSSNNENAKPAGTKAIDAKPATSKKALNKTAAATNKKTGRSKKTSTTKVEKKASSTKKASSARAEKKKHAAKAAATKSKSKPTSKPKSMKEVAV